MTGHSQGPVDERLLEELRLAIEEADPIPGSVDEFAAAIFDLVDVEGHVANLVWDSQSAPEAGVRSAALADRAMTFQAPGVEIEITVLGEGRRRLVGQLVPPQAADIEIYHRLAVSAHTRSDSLGRFVFNDLPLGPLSLTCRLDDDGQTVVQTEWTIV